MDLPAGQIPDQPCIDTAEQQFTVPGTLATAFDVVENPFHLGRRKIGIYNQTGVLANVRFQPSGFQLIADTGGAATLPDDCVANRFAGGLFPDDAGFALIGNANRSY